MKLTSWHLTSRQVDGVQQVMAPLIMEGMSNHSNPVYHAMVHPPSSTLQPLLYSNEIFFHNTLHNAVRVGILCVEELCAADVWSRARSGHRMSPHSTRPDGGRDQHPSACVRCSGPGMGGTEISWFVVFVLILHTIHL